MTIIGIDPGTTGALAIYNEDENIVVGVYDIPNMEREYGKGLQVDAVELHELLMRVVTDDTVFIIEDVGSMPKQGVVSSFNFGHTVGTIYGVISAMGLPRYRIHPATWKKKFGLVGTGKYATLEMVKVVYPSCLPMLKLKKHHNRADAIAIAVAGSKLT